MEKLKNSKQKGYVITIKDLAPQEKEKIGQLVKRLAEETALKNQYKLKYQQIKIKYDELVQKYDEQIIKQQQQNRFLKMEIRNSCRDLQRSHENLKKKRSCQKKINFQFEDQYRKQGQQRQTFGKENSSNLSNLQKSNSNSRSSKKMEIIELRQEIEKLTQNIKAVSTSDKNKCDTTFDEKIKQYEVIKNRYNASNNNNNNLNGSVTYQQTLLLDTTFKQDKILQNSGFVQPKMMIRQVYQQDQTINQNLKKSYETAQVSKKRYDDGEIGTTIKKSQKQKSFIYKESFYDCDLLDLVQQLEK